MEIVTPESERANFDMGRGSVTVPQMFAAAALVRVTRQGAAAAGETADVRVFCLPCSRRESVRF